MRNCTKCNTFHIKPKIIWEFGKKYIRCLNCNNKFETGGK